MNKTRFVLRAAGLSLAISLTIGCGGGPKTTAEITGAQEVKSIENELLELCNKDFIKDNFCGVGQGSSSNESMASQIANTIARRELATSIQSTIDAKIKISAMNDPSLQALEATAARTVSTVSQEVTDVRIQKVRTMYNAQEKVYTIYTLITSPRADAMNMAKQKLLANEELAQIQRAMNVQVNVDRMLD